MIVWKICIWLKVICSFLMIVYLVLMSWKRWWLWKLLIVSGVICVFYCCLFLVVWCVRIVLRVFMWNGKCFLSVLLCFCLMCRKFSVCIRCLVVLLVVIFLLFLRMIWKWKFVDWMGVVLNWSVCWWCMKMIISSSVFSLSRWKRVFLCLIVCCCGWIYWLMKCWLIGLMKFRNGWMRCRKWCDLCSNMVIS